MPSNPDGSFDSSRLLAYRDYLVKYLKFIENVGGIAGKPQALGALMGEIQKDFPNEVVHPLDVIVAALDVTDRISRVTRFNAVELTQEIVRRWDPSQHVSSRERVSSALDRAGFVLPSRVNRNVSGRSGIRN